jgi:hypothetical protein
MFKAPFTSAKGRHKNSAIIASVATDQLYFLDIDSICVVSSVEAKVSLAGIFVANIESVKEPFYVLNF